MSLGTIFVFSFVSYTISDVQALSIFDFASCKHTLDELEDIGPYTHTALFANSDAQRFCISMFEKGITLTEIKDHHEIPQLGIQIDLPKNWSGYEVYHEDMTITFVTPDKKKSNPVEPLWMTFVIIDKSVVEETSKKIHKLVSESLDDVPHFTNTCKFKETTNVEINDREYKEEIITCIDRRLALFVTITSYSFILNDQEIFLVSATRHLPNLSPGNISGDYLQTLKIEKFTGNTEHDNIQVSETKKNNIPSWFKKHVVSWGMGEISNGELISMFKFIFRNNLYNDSHYSNPGFYNQAKIPEWFRDNAMWFGKGLVTEDEFRTSFKYLVENRIIVI